MKKARTLALLGALFSLFISPAAARTLPEVVSGQPTVAAFRLSSVQQFVEDAEAVTSALGEESAALMEELHVALEEEGARQIDLERPLGAVAVFMPTSPTQAEVLLVVPINDAESLPPPPEDMGMAYEVRGDWMLLAPTPLILQSLEDFGAVESFLTAPMEDSMEILLDLSVLAPIYAMYEPMVAMMAGQPAIQDELNGIDVVEWLPLLKQLITEYSNAGEVRMGYRIADETIRFSYSLDAMEGSAYAGALVAPESHEVPVAAYVPAADSLVVVKEAWNAPAVTAWVDGVLRRLGAVAPERYRENFSEAADWISHYGANWDGTLALGNRTKMTFDTHTVPGTSELLLHAGYGGQYDEEALLGGLRRWVDSGALEDFFAQFRNPAQPPVEPTAEGEEATEKEPEAAPLFALEQTLTADVGTVEANGEDVRLHAFSLKLSDSVDSMSLRMVLFFAVTPRAVLVAPTQAELDTMVRRILRGEPVDGSIAQALPGPGNQLMYKSREYALFYIVESFESGLGDEASELRDVVEAQSWPDVKGTYEAGEGTLQGKLALPLQILRSAREVMATFEEMYGSLPVEAPPPPEDVPEEPAAEDEEGS